MPKKTLPWSRYSVIVRRDSSEEQTYAIVSATVNFKHHLFMFKVITAVTEWVTTTKAGHEAWEHSSNDFNVGDLAGELGDQDLERLLEKRGIRDMTIDVNSSPPIPVSVVWSFDQVLADVEA